MYCYCLPLDHPEEELAGIFQDLSVNDAQKGATKSLLRRVVKVFSILIRLVMLLTVVYNELDFAALVKGLIKDRPDFFQQLDSAIKVSCITNLVDLICLTQILSIPAGLHESHTTPCLLSLYASNFIS
jgi:hypothetical protein